MDIARLLFGFEGRIRRLHYWIASICAGVMISVCAGPVLMLSGVYQVMWGMHAAPNMTFVAAFAMLAILQIWIGLALGVKRCHDRDKSGWFMAVGLIPLIGGLWLLIDLGFMDGTPGPNRYGPSPKDLTVQPAFAPV